MSDNAVLASRIAELERQLVASNSERDALASQVHVLRTAAKFILDAKLPLAKRKAYAALADAVNKTPEQHLLELRAGAGRAGYLACANFYGLANTYASRKGIDRTASQYADHIRRGGAS